MVGCKHQLLALIQGEQREVPYTAMRLSPLFFPAPQSYCAKDIKSFLAYLNIITSEANVA